MKKRMSKKLAWLLVACMVALLFPVAALASNANNGVLEGNKPLKSALTSLDGYPKPQIDITAANLLPLNGYFKQTVTIGTKSRTVKVYIPQGAPIRAFFTVITVPDGWDTEDFLHKSGWIGIAQKRMEGLYILESGEGGWGSFDDELQYVTAAITKFKDTTYYSTMGMYYLAGYGKGGAALQGWAVNNPLFVISQAYIDADDLSSDYLNTTGAKLYGTDLARFEDVPYRDVPIPTWIIDADLSSVNNAVSYWKAANDCNAAGQKDSKLLDSLVYAQSASSDAWPTSYSGPISKVATLQKTFSKTDIVSNKLTSTIYDFLSYYTRYDNSCVYGNGLGIRGSYKVDNINITEPDGRTWVREYITYIPASYTGKTAVPVVYAFPGGSQTGRVFFEATQWYVAAEKYGFIVVMPSSQYSSATSVTWNYDNKSIAPDATRPAGMANDYPFIKAVIEKIDATYNTDKGRRYATGQSQGSIMAESMSFWLPEYFAAIGSTSAPVTSTPEGGSTCVIPVFIGFGEQDIDPYNYFTAADYANYKTYKSVTYWTARNGLKDAFHWDSYEHNGRYNTYTWNNSEGIPLYKYNWTEGRKHNNLHAEADLLWSTWFTNWTMKDGVRFYNGKAVNP